MQHARSAEEEAESIRTKESKGEKKEDEGERRENRGGTARGGAAQKLHTPLLKRLLSFEGLVSMAGVAVVRGPYGGPDGGRRHAVRGRL